MPHASEPAGAKLPPPDAVCDGGDLDCGSGLLLIIRRAMMPLGNGGVLEVRSREGSVAEDLPAWCRLVGHGFLGARPLEDAAGSTAYLVEKQVTDEALRKDLEKARAFQWAARVRWQGGMAARAFVRNHAFDLGQPASFDTRDPAPSAVETLLAALGGCLAVGLQWRLSRREVAVRNLEVSLRARADNILVFLGLADDGHPGLARVEGALYIDCDGDDDELAALWEETLRRSPLARSLTETVPIDVAFRRA